MACFHPLPAWRAVEGYNPSTRKRSLTFDRAKGIPGSELTVPCGQCIGCRLERSRQWAIRCVHEASLHEHNQFITLTFDDAHLPADRSLDVLILQKFLKRYRKMYSDVKIRYFACGEYGELLQRPHYHLQIFGHSFEDRKVLMLNHGYPIYTSDSLSRLWPFGYSSVANTTFESCAYVARYITKKVTGDPAAEHYAGRHPEYCVMSRRPGIAHDWFVSFERDVYPHDYVVIRDGIKCKPPKYYDSLFDLHNPELMRSIKAERCEQLKKHADNNTPDRLNVRERIQQLKAEKLIRPLEVV